MVEGAGVPLAVQEHGDPAAPAVLLVHGMAADARTWAQAAARLAAGGLHAIAYDRRGYGASGAPEPYVATTVAEQSADAVAVLDAFGVPWAVVAGDGFGALVALDVALRHPGRVTALVCGDPPLFLLVPDAAHALATERAALEDALRAGGREAAIAGWLQRRDADADADGAAPAAIARAQAAAAGFFADYAGLASLSLTRRALRGVDVPAVVVTGPTTEPDVVAAADALGALVPHARRAHDGDLAAGILQVAA